MPARDHKEAVDDSDNGFVAIFGLELGYQ